MTYDLIERIKEGSFDFINDITPNNLIILAGQIRNSEDKRELIDIILPELIDTQSKFCLKLIYDDDEYENETRYILSKGNIHLEEHEIINLVTRTSWGINYIIENADNIFKILSCATRNEIFDYILKNHQDKIELFKTHSNLHVRCLFMQYIITEHEDYLHLIYENILDYLTSITNLPNEQLTLIPELMDIKDVSDLYHILFKSKYKDIYCSILKEYILNNYPNNDIAFNLLNDFSEKDEECILAFREDADVLFKTSRTYQFYIYKNCSEFVSKELIDDFKKHLRGFRPEETRYLERIFKYELGEKFLKYVDKYLSLSSNTNVNFIDHGSTSAAYKIGDYCLRLVISKWSYEDTICPDLYLIAKNYEEDYVRDENGEVTAGLEVQKYFARSASDVPDNILKLYEQELKRLGYYATDAFWGENCRLLDSYKQANCTNPEILPDWFKEYPMVLVDRDCVYRNGSKPIKQLRQRTINI